MDGKAVYKFSIELAESIKIKKKITRAFYKQQYVFEISVFIRLFITYCCKSCIILNFVVNRVK